MHRKKYYQELHILTHNIILDIYSQHVTGDNWLISTLYNYETVNKSRVLGVQEEGHIP